MRALTPTERRVLGLTLTKLAAVVCYGPAHADEVFQVGNCKENARLFEFSPPVLPETLISDGWMVKMTWRCPECVALDRLAKPK